MAHMFRLSTAFISQVPGITRRGRNVAGLAAILAVALVPGLVTAQSSGGSQGSASQDDPAIRFRMPTVTVTAQKEPEDKQRVPVSVTAVSKDTIDSAGIHIVSEAAIFAPNTFFTEWSARKLSNARFRGISSSPNNPGITTYIDGVPQLSANSSSIELLDVNQIEFVRGPQSALFGRNTLGGLVNITSARPSVSTWTGTLSVPFGNYGSWAVRGGVSGPDRFRQAQHRSVVRAGGPRWLYGQRRHGQRHRFPLGLFGKGAAPLAAEQRLGRARDLQWRAGSRRRLLAQRRRRAPQQPVPCRARLRRSRRPGCDGHHDPGATRQRPGGVLEHHGIPELEDSGRDRPRLHAASRF